MKWGMGGVLGIGLMLIALEVLVSSAGTTGSGASGVASLAAWPGRLASSWMNPAVPLIPQLAAPASSSSGSGGYGGNQLRTVKTPQGPVPVTGVVSRYLG